MKDYDKAIHRVDVSLEILEALDKKHNATLLELSRQSDCEKIVAIMGRLAGLQDAKIVVTEYAVEAVSTVNESLPE